MAGHYVTSATPLCQVCALTRHQLSKLRRPHGVARTSHVKSGRMTNGEISQVTYQLVIPKVPTQGFPFCPQPLPLDPPMPQEMTQYRPIAPPRV